MTLQEGSLANKFTPFHSALFPHSLTFLEVTPLAKPTGKEKVLDTGLYRLPAREERRRRVEGVSRGQRDVSPTDTFHIIQ